MLQQAPISESKGSSQCAWSCSKHPWQLLLTYIVLLQLRSLISRHMQTVVSHEEGNWFLHHMNYTSYSAIHSYRLLSSQPSVVMDSTVNLSPDAYLYGSKPVAWCPVTAVSLTRARTHCSSSQDWKTAFDLVNPQVQGYKLSYRGKTAGFWHLISSRMNHLHHISQEDDILWR